MGLSSTAYVEYWPAVGPGGKWHGHMALAADESSVVMGIEDVAGALAEAVLRCHEDRHNGHGYQHKPDEAEKAYRSAVEQLLTKSNEEFEAEHEELLRKIRLYKKWGGHPPAAVLLHTQDAPDELKVMVTDKNGDPWMYKANPAMAEVMPSPKYTGATPDPVGVGFLRKRRIATAKRFHLPLAIGGR